MRLRARSCGASAASHVNCAASSGRVGRRTLARLQPGACCWKLVQAGPMSTAGASLFSFGGPFLPGACAARGGLPAHASMLSRTTS